MIHASAFVHPKAHVEGATIGARTKVWQFSSVIRGAVLGEDCTVAAGACLDGPIFGDRCIVCPGVDIGPGFRIGSDVFLGPNVVLCNDMWPSASKDGFDFDALRRGDRFAVIVEDGASIGANAVILPGVRIGRGSVVAAGAVVNRDVPDGMLWCRNGYMGVHVPKDAAARRMRWARDMTGIAAARAAAEADGTLVLDRMWANAG